MKRANKSIEVAQMWRNMEARKSRTHDAAAQRERLRNAISQKHYEFRSGAVVSDGTPEPRFERDEELYFHPTTWPARGGRMSGRRKTVIRFRRWTPPAQGSLWSSRELEAKAGWMRLERWTRPTRLRSKVL